jgi:hypothetical protein
MTRLTALDRPGFGPVGSIAKSTSTHTYPIHTPGSPPLVPSSNRLSLTNTGQIHYSLLTRTMPQPKLFDSIILGAGWSGAVAARDLASKGYSVLVLEARDRVGGRAKTWVGPGAKIDVGCSWIHGYREGNPARGIAKELGVVSVAASSLRS